MHCFQLTATKLTQAQLPTLLLIGTPAAGTPNRCGLVLHPQPRQRHVPTALAYLATGDHRVEWRAASAVDRRYPVVCNLQVWGSWSAFELWSAVAPLPGCSWVASNAAL